MTVRVGSKVLIKDTSADCPSGRGVVMEFNANKTECLVLYDDGYEATRGWFSVDLLEGVKETEPPPPLPEREPRPPLPEREPRTVWLLRASDGREQWIESVYVDKVKAEADMRLLKNEDALGSFFYWIQEKEITR